MALAEHVLNRIGGACRDGGGTAIAVLSVLGALLMLQGGYAPPVSSAGALALCVTGLILLAGVRRGPRLSMSPACVVALLVPLALLLAAFAHGISYERLEPMGRWALFVAAVVLSASIMPQLGRRLLSALSWGGVATSVLGLIMVDSSFEFLGWSNAGRLQFSSSTPTRRGYGSRRSPYSAGSPQAPSSGSSCLSPSLVSCSPSRAAHLPSLRPPSWPWL